MDIDSVTLTFFNDAGDREAHFVMRRTWLDKLLGRPAREFTFVQPQSGGTVWHAKGSGRWAGTSWDLACCNAVEWARQEAAKRDADWPVGA